MSTAQTQAYMLTLLYVYPVQMERLMLICANPLRGTLGILVLRGSCRTVGQNEREHGERTQIFREY